MGTNEYKKAFQTRGNAMKNRQGIMLADPTQTLGWRVFFQRYFMCTTTQESVL